MKQNKVFLYVLKYNPQLYIVLNEDGDIVERVSIPSYIPEEALYNHINSVLQDKCHDTGYLYELKFNGYTGYNDIVSSFSESSIANQINEKSYMINVIFFHSQFACAYSTDMSRKIVKVDYTSSLGVIEQIKKYLIDSKFIDKPYVCGISYTTENATPLYPKQSIESKVLLLDNGRYALWLDITLSNGKYISLNKHMYAVDANLMDNHRKIDITRSLLSDFNIKADKISIDVAKSYNPSYYKYGVLVRSVIPAKDVGDVDKTTIIPTIVESKGKFTFYIPKQGENGMMLVNHGTFDNIDDIAKISKLVCGDYLDNNGELMIVYYRVDYVIQAPVR